jgi:hypothetical protein
MLTVTFFYFLGLRTRVSHLVLIISFCVYSSVIYLNPYCTFPKGLMVLSNVPNDLEFALIS